MRRTTTRSPSGRNFIGILFRKFLELLDYYHDAALASNECQCRARYLGRWRGAVKTMGPRKRQKGGPRSAPKRGPADMNSQSALRPFRGILAFRSNRLPK